MVPMSMNKKNLTALLLLALTAPLLRAQQTVLPLWPHGTPEPAQTTEPERDVTKDTDTLIDGHRTARLTNVTNPTITVYAPPADKNTRTAALVFPGGGYLRLAWTGEGIDTCDWLTSVGVTCLLVKYRVPEEGHYPANFAPLEDAQQAMRLARAHAAEWNINPNHIGVVGFSAGANLAVLLSTHPEDHHIDTTPAAHEVPHITAEASGAIELTGMPDARPDFAIIVYPAYLAVQPGMTTLDPVYAPNKFTPPTFLIQAEDDKTYGRNAPVYFQALAAAGVPAELHMFATGGHGFGVHPPNAPEEHWTRLANSWLRSISMLPAYTQRTSSQTAVPRTVPTVPAAPAATPCPTTNGPTNPPGQASSQPGHANNPSTNSPDVPCY